MIDFNEQEIIKKADALYALRTKFEEIADKVCEKGFDNILFTSAGGSLAALEPYLLYDEKYVKNSCIYRDPCGINVYGKCNDHRQNSSYFNVKVRRYERNCCCGKMAGGKKCDNHCFMR